MKHLTTERLVLGAVALLVGLLLGWMMRGVASYNPKVGTAAVYDDWRTACPGSDIKQASCQMISDVVDNSTGTPNAIARVLVTTDPTNGKQVMEFTLPYGVALEAGMGMILGKDPVKVFQYRTCNNVGCVAVTDFDSKMETAMRGAEDGRLLFAGVTDGKPVSVPISFKGYKAAYRAYKSNEAKRHNWFWRLWS